MVYAEPVILVQHNIISAPEVNQFYKWLADDEREEQRQKQQKEVEKQNKKKREEEAKEAKKYYTAEDFYAAELDLPLKRRYTVEEPENRELLSERELKVLDKKLEEQKKVKTMHYYLDWNFNEPGNRERQVKIADLTI